MATDQNPELISVAAPTVTGYKYAYLLGRNADGSFTRGLFRGYPGPTLTNGEHTTTQVSHMMTSDVCDDGMQVGKVTIGTTATRLDATPGVLAYRKWVAMRKGSGAFYMGFSSSVTTSNGTLVDTTDLPIILPLGVNLTVYGIVASGTVDLDVLQGA